MRACLFVRACACCDEGWAQERVQLHRLPKQARQQTLTELSQRLQSALTKVECGLAVTSLVAQQPPTGSLLPQNAACRTYVARSPAGIPLTPGWLSRRTQCWRCSQIVRTEAAGHRHEEVKLHPAPPAAVPASMLPFADGASTARASVAPSHKVGHCQPALANVSVATAEVCL